MIKIAVCIEDRTDHLGNVFESKPKMCEYYGIDNGTYNTRIKKGMTKEQALTTPVKAVSIEDRTDHLGNVFKSIGQMCEHYDLYHYIYRDRIKNGWSKEKALTTPLTRNYDENNRTDHLGNVFESKPKMCEYYGIDNGTYNTRIKKGWSKEKALTTPLIRNRDENNRTDHLGNVFKSIGQMCNFYKVSQNNYLSRLRGNYTKEEALGIVPLLDRRTNNIQFTNEITVIRFVYKTDNLRYFECKINGIKDILSSDDIIGAFRKTLKKETE